MNLVAISVPEDFAVNCIVSELNSFSYIPEIKCLVYIKGFSAAEDGSVNADVVNYELNDDDVVATYFKVSNDIGMKLIDTEGIVNSMDKQLAIHLLNTMLTKLHEHMETAKVISNDSTSIFGNIPMQEEAAAPVDLKAMYREGHNIEDEKK